MRARPMEGRALFPCPRIGVEKPTNDCYSYKTFIPKTMHLLTPFKALVVKIPG